MVLVVEFVRIYENISEKLREGRREAAGQTLAASQNMNVRGSHYWRRRASLDADESGQPSVDVRKPRSGDGSQSISKCQ